MLTGRSALKRTFTGKVILQVEEDVEAVWPMSRKRPYRRRWRNATLMDLTSVALRPLMDLQHRPPSLGVEVASARPLSEEKTPNVVPMAPRSTGA